MTRDSNIINTISDLKSDEAHLFLLLVIYVDCVSAFAIPTAFCFCHKGIFGSLKLNLEVRSLERLLLVDVDNTLYNASGFKGLFAVGKFY